MPRELEIADTPERLLRRACAELERRLRDGEAARAEHWLDAHPELRAEPDLALELVLLEYTTREEAGDSPAPAEWFARFPQWRDRLERLFTLLNGDTAPAAGTTPAARPPAGPESPPGYELRERIGTGGMGVVYAALQRGTDRLVAVKMLRAGPYADEAELRRFRAEAEAVARLQHPHIVQIFEVGEHNEQPFFSMEYLAGGSLDAHLSGRPLPPRDAADLTRTLAEAIQYAHQRGVLHRDLKPANILLQQKSEIRSPKSEGKSSPDFGFRISDFELRVSDFGLAKRLDLESGAISAAVVGTVGYMAPEQAAGQSRTVGPAADVYALGAILYECLTGRPPHRGESALDTLRQVVHDEPVPPRRLRPKLPRDLETVALCCLQKEPAKRYASAAALAEDLRRFLAGEPILARPVGAAERAWKWARRRPAAAALIAVAALAAAGFVGLLAWRDVERAADNARLVVQRDRADVARWRAGRALHAARMSLAQQALEHDQPGRVADLLRVQEPTAAEPDDHRGFEWYYLRHLGRAGRLAELPRPGGRIHAVAFSPDGRTLALAGGEGAVLLWDVPTRRVRATLPITALDGRSGTTFATLAFTPDGRTLVVADGRLRFWDAVLAQPLTDAPLMNWPARCVAVAPDGATLAVGQGDGVVELHDMAGVRPCRLLHGRHVDAVTAVAFSPDGRTLATISRERDVTAKLWDVAAGRERATIHANQPLTWVRDVAFSPDGRTLAIAEGAAHDGSKSGAVRLVDATTLGTLQPPWLVAAPGARSVAFAPDGRSLAAGMTAGVIRVWDLVTQAERVSFVGHEDFVHALEFDPDGSALAAGCHDGSAAVWDPQALPQPRALRCPGPFRPLRSVALLPDGSGFLVGGDDARVRTWDFARDRFRADTLPGAEKGGTAIAVSPDGRWVASPCPEQRGGIPPNPRTPAHLVALCDAATGRCRHWLAGHENTVVGVAFSPDGTRLATAGYDGTVRLWDPETGTCLTTLADFRGRVWSVAFSPDGRLIAAGGAGGRVVLWDAATHQPAGELQGSTSNVQAIAFSADGRRLAAAQWGGRTQLWDVPSRTAVAELRELGSVLCLAFTPDGSTLATGTTSGTIRLWDTAIGQEQFVLKAHGGWVQGLAFTADGETLISSSDDGTIRLWRGPRD